MGDRGIAEQFPTSAVVTLRYLECTQLLPSRRQYHWDPPSTKKSHSQVFCDNAINSYVWHVNCSLNCSNVILQFSSNFVFTNIMVSFSSATSTGVSSPTVIQPSENLLCHLITNDRHTLYFPDTISIIFLVSIGVFPRFTQHWVIVLVLVLFVRKKKIDCLRFSLAKPKCQMVSKEPMMMLKVCYIS